MALLQSAQGPSGAKEPLHLHPAFHKPRCHVLKVFLLSSLALPARLLGGHLHAKIGRAHV